MSAPGPHRLDAGGRIDRTATLAFRFDGRAFEGHPGDTLASALLANGVRLMGRSFKYHRPRGVLTAGPEEPNALVTLGAGARAEPNARATVAELFDGLEARSQNRWPSLAFDALGINDLLSSLLGAGFYYKTFMWPAAFWEKVYEPLIRRAAGLGALSGAEDPDRYDKGFLHCDLLVIGAGPAGLAAALAAARAGLRVILADEDFAPGGRLNAETHEIDGAPGGDWAAAALAELSGRASVRLMTRTTVYGAFDHGVYGALERMTDHLADAGDTPRQVLWRIRAKRAVLAAGAIERPIAFPGNDRPGVMLAGAVRAYAGRWGVAAGRRIIVFANTDDAWAGAAELIARGARVAAIIDPRSGPPRADAPGAEIHMGAEVIATHGRRGLTAVDLRGADGAVRRLEADCLAVSGGWNPAVHLTCHQRGRPVWREDIAAFVPGGAVPPGMRVAGAASGALTLGAALAEGHAAGEAAARDLGAAPADGPAPRAADEPFALAPFWHVRGAKGRAWLDFQNDVTVKDVVQAHQEGFRSVEHMKRYTTLGMATDQGKIANIPALAVMAEAAGARLADVGTTMFRPPWTPVSIAAFAGRARGRAFRPTRLTPSHAWAEERGAVFTETGAWLRAQWFPQPGETHWRQSVDREVRAVRERVGVCDVTTLGKIDIQGPDAAEFLNRVYCNGFAKLPVGKCRYGLMLREDGFVMDDGTTARLGERHFLMTTTTANAVPVFRHLEFCRQCLWPDLDVHLVSATEQWAQFAVAGPSSRAVLRKLVDLDLAPEAFPFMACAAAEICGVSGRIFRISFSGELAYEVAVPARYGDALIRAIMAAGEAEGIAPYGTEALGVLRVEKGHVAGAELNGTTTAQMLGLGAMVSAKKDSIGRVLAGRDALVAEDGLRLVGLKPLDRSAALRAGAHLLARGAAAVTANDEGHVTSAAHSPTLGHSIGLALLQRGDARRGEVMRAHDPVRGPDVEVEVVSPHFVDPEGARQRG